MAAVLVFAGMSLGNDPIGSAPINNPVFPTTSDSVTIDFAVANVGDEDAGDVTVTVTLTDPDNNQVGDSKSVAMGAIPHQTATQVVSTDAFGPLAAGTGYYADCAITDGQATYCEFNVSDA